MARPQTALEERWNVYTHGFGILSFIGVAAVLFYLIFGDDHDPFIFWGTTVYAISQIFLYCASTWYHHAPMGKLKSRLRKLDHISIYISIAGTYTPICLITLADTCGFTILWISWGIMAFGTIWKLFFTGKFEVLSSGLYLIMGWLIVIDLPSLQAGFNDFEMFWLVAGGVFFTLGIVFYGWSKLYFNHVIWHFFVLAGSFSHALMVWSVVSGAIWVS